MKRLLDDVPIHEAPLPLSATSTATASGNTLNNTIYLPPHPNAGVALSNDAPLPWLTITNALEIQLAQDNGIRWVRQHDGQPVLIAAVINRPEDGGRKAFPAESIAVRLEFRDSQGFVCSIPRAYWIDYSENVVNIKVAINKEFILGMRDGDHWIIFSNERDSPIKVGEDDGVGDRSVSHSGGLPGGVGYFRTTHHRIRSRRIPCTEGLCVTATVFSDKTGKDFDKRTFNLYEA